MQISVATYKYPCSLANLPKFARNNCFRASLPAGAVAQAGFRNEAKICQITTCTIPQPQYLYHCYTMHVLRNTDFAHRNPNVEQIPIMYDFYYSDRDYIGKMLDEFGLINMPARRNGNEGGNGRCGVYPDFIGNPVVGRFLSPDIIVQNPNNTQCYNRYSYAINNPLKYSDPSGWSWTPIQAANHANMMAMTMTMRFQDNFQPSVIRSGSSSRGNGYLFGSNAIVFQNAEATLQMALGDIAHILSSVFGMPGLFGNPGNDDTKSKAEIDGEYDTMTNSSKDPIPGYQYSVSIEFKYTEYFGLGLKIKGGDGEVDLNGPGVQKAREFTLIYLMSEKRFTYNANGDDPMNIDYKLGLNIANIVGFVWSREYPVTHTSNDAINYFDELAYGGSMKEINGKEWDPSWKYTVCNGSFGGGIIWEHIFEYSIYLWYSTYNHK